MAYFWTFVAGFLAGALAILIPMWSTDYDGE